MVPGYEQAMRGSRRTAASRFVSAPIRTGRGTETTLAQVAHEILGVDFDKIKVVQGDTAVHALFDRRPGDRAAW